MLPRMEANARKRFNFDFPSLDELSKKTAVMLINTDSAIDFPEPLEPNMIPVGGLQIAPIKALPDVSFFIFFVLNKIVKFVLHFL